MKAAHLVALMDTQMAALKVLKRVVPTVVRWDCR